MTDAYEVLGLTPSAGEADVRRRYLELVREFPPDRAPEKFRAIRAAYDELRDPARRIEAQLFQLDRADSLDALVADIRARLREARVPLDTLLGLAERP
jgi:curved DNA-binding protein CbpA